jgi:hypothetical protein
MRPMSPGISTDIGLPPSAVSPITGTPSLPLNVIRSSSRMRQ